MSFLPIFAHYPAEAATIGRLLAGYTELEFDLHSCIDAVCNDFDATFKALFRTRGETQRIEIADALGRGKYQAMSLGTEFEMAIGALQHCRKIRNQYAHCHWHKSNLGIGFVDLEEVAKERALAGSTSQFTYRSLDASLLEQQENYFQYTSAAIMWLEHEAKVKNGKLAKNPDAKPKQLAPPPLYKP